MSTSVAGSSAVKKKTRTTNTFVKSLNVGGYSTIESKRCEIGVMFGKRGMDGCIGFV